MSTASAVRQGEWVGGLKAGLQIGMTFIPTFLTVGAVAEQVSMGVVAATVMTLLVFAAPAQLVVLDFLKAGQSLVDILVAVLIVNLRFLLMSVGLSKYLAGVPYRKLLPALSMLSASTFAISYLGMKSDASDDECFDYYLGVCVASFPFAVTATAVGYMTAQGLPASISSVMPILVALYFAGWIAKSWPEWGPIVATGLGVIVTPLTSVVTPRFTTIVTALIVGAALALTEYGTHE